MDEPLPVPGSLRELVGVRVRELPPPVRRVLLAAGALTRPTVGQLVRLERGAERALRVAAEAGIVELVGTHDPVRGEAMIAFGWAVAEALAAGTFTAPE